MIQPGDNPAENFMNRGRAEEYLKIPEFREIFPVYFEYLYDSFFRQLLEPHEDMAQFQIDLVKEHIPIILDRVRLIKF